MDIYVQTRGFAQDNDYRWLKITETSQQRPEKLPYFLQKSADLIFSESPSIVIARNGQWLIDLYLKDAVKLIHREGINFQSLKAINNLCETEFQKFTLQNSGKLCLLVTGLEPNSRTDFDGRQIRVSLACICEASDKNEQCLRWLAARAIEEENKVLLTEQISQIVTLGGEDGFQVNYQDLLNLIQQDKIKKLSNTESLDEAKIKIASDPQLKTELATDLIQYRLPKRETPLVVCTDIKAEKTLIEAQVWRGISSLVKADGWKYIDQGKNLGFSKKSFEEWVLAVALSNKNIVFLLLKIIFFPLSITAIIAFIIILNNVHR